MDTLVNLLEKYLGSILKTLWQLVLRILICAKKLALPVRDVRTDIKQSRMRYYLVQFSFPNGSACTAYQEIDSNGQLKRYTNLRGVRFLPEEKHVCSIIGDRKFQLPKWRKIDWHDVGNGQIHSGCWGITEQ